MTDSFHAKSELTVGSKTYTYYDLTKLEAEFKVSRLPYSYKILLENMLRHEDGTDTTRRRHPRAGLPQAWRSCRRRTSTSPPPG